MGSYCSPSLTGNCGQWRWGKRESKNKKVSAPALADHLILLSLALRTAFLFLFLIPSLLLSHAHARQYQTAAASAAAPPRAVRVI